MSFNYKPKVIIKNIDIKKLYSNYNEYLNNPVYKKFLTPFSNEIHECNECKNIISFGDQIFGIPVAIKEEKSKLCVDICGTYCSFKCAYIDFNKMELYSSKKKNIKYIDSGPLFKYLFYKIYKSYDIESQNSDINLYDLNIELKYSNPNIIS